MGIVIQNRKWTGTAADNKYVKTLKMATSDDNSTWTNVESAKVFNTGCTNNNDTRHDVKFAATIKARYIKIMPQTWESKIAMRVGLILDKAEGEGKYEIICLF